MCRLIACAALLCSWWCGDDGGLKWLEGKKRKLAAGQANERAGRHRQGGKRDHAAAAEKWASKLNGEAQKSKATSTSKEEVTKGKQGSPSHEKHTAEAGAALRAEGFTQLRLGSRATADSLASLDELVGKKRNGLKETGNGQETEVCCMWL